ncbi:MAG: class I SAM-dependent methyltransferase [Minicystis sp.]
MTTLTTPPLSTLLVRLFADAEATQVTLRSELAKLPPDERAALMSSAQTDYRAFYGRAKDLHLAVSPATASLLYLLARSTRARAIVEFGTSFGISTLHLAAALRDNGGGHLVGSEFEPAKVAGARENLAAAGLSDLVDIREGDALETLARDLPTPIDLVLLDGAKVLYPKVLALLEPHLRDGALIVADNADASPEYLARVRSVGNGYVSVPFAEDVELVDADRRGGGEGVSGAVGC